MKKVIISSVVKCPNHGEPLEMDAIQRTQRRGSAPCPVSKVLFSFSQEPLAEYKDKEGNPLLGFVIEGED